MSENESIDGASLVARSLRDQGVEYMFGVVGIPIIEVALKAQQYGIKYIGMRNEQSASYAASAIGYLTRKPAVCLVVSGPGFVHALAGMSNANENSWPLIVIGGSSENVQESTGSFQEFPQVAIASLKSFAKYAARPATLAQIPFIIEKAFRASTYGRPGAVYVDLSAEMVNSLIDTSEISPARVCGEAPRPFASPSQIDQVFEAIRESRRPLFVLGKGAAYAQAEQEIRRLVAKLGLPFLPTPMGKGVCDDDSELCVNAARSTALKEADLIVLLGARLNWMLHFGRAPRFHERVRVIQVDVQPEELGNNTDSTTCLEIQADLKSFAQQMLELVDKRDVRADLKAEWWSLLREKTKKNKSVIQDMANDTRVPLNYYATYAQIKKELPVDYILVSEGANTMDTSRAILNHRLPRHRLDAGSFGTMGVGTGFAIAAALYCRDHNPQKRVVCIQGDSAFGFSGMEIETAFRYKLPIVFIIFNNNGIYSGLDEESFSQMRDSGDPAINLPPVSLTAGIRYEKMAAAFDGFRGYFASTPEEISTALRSALAENSRPSLINIAINPAADRKAQDFPWLTKSKI